MIPILYQTVTEGVVPSDYGLGALTDTISASVTEERNGGYELTLTYSANGIHAEELKPNRIIKAKPNFSDSPQLFRIYKIGKTINGQFTVNAAHISYDLSGKVATTGTASSCVAACLLLTSDFAGNFTITTDKTTVGNFSITEPSSVRSWFGGKAGSLLDVYGSAEWHYDNYTASLLTARGLDRGVVIRYGKNLTDLSQTLDISNLATAITPFAKNNELGSVAVGASVSTGLSLDYDREKAVDFSDSVDWEESTPINTQLAALAAAYVSKYTSELTTITDSITLDFVQLSSLEERVDLCDVVHIYFEALGISASAKCVATTWDVLEERYTSATFGDPKTSIATTVAEQQIKLENTPDKTQVVGIVNRQTELITGNLGGYVVMHDADLDGKPDEILIMNTPDINTATDVIRMNLGGIGFSNGNGYAGPYTTALSFSGIVADAITTGVLNANLIKAGVIEDLLGNSQIDLSNGEASLYQLIARAYLTVEDAGTHDVLARLVAGAYGGILRLYNRNNTEALTAFVGGGDDGVLDVCDSAGNVTASLVGATGVAECDHVKARTPMVELFSGSWSSGYNYVETPIVHDFKYFVFLWRTASSGNYQTMVVPASIALTANEMPWQFNTEAQYFSFTSRVWEYNGADCLLLTFKSKTSGSSAYIEKVYGIY